MNGNPDLPFSWATSFYGQPNYTTFLLDNPTGRNRNRILLGDSNWFGLSQEWTAPYQGIQLAPVSRGSGQSGYRHGLEKANYLFFDLHVQRVTYRGALVAVTDPASFDG